MIIEIVGIIIRVYVNIIITRDIDYIVVIIVVVRIILETIVL